MSRTDTVLSRFPVHLGADRPGTLLREVVDGLAGGLDVQSSQLGRVRAARRLAGLDEEADLLLLAGLHGLQSGTFGIVRERLAGASSLAEVLDDPAAGADDLEAALGSLPHLLGVPAESFPDPAALVDALHRLVAYAAVLDAMRRTVTRVVAAHRQGNATVGALVSAAGAYLALDVLEVIHLEDRFWHVARCTDALLVTRDADGTSGPVPPVDDLLALEENPFRPQTIEPVPRRPGESFTALRGGFDEVLVTVRVRGIEDRTVAPMVVAVSAGLGVAWTGTVPDGEELRFEGDGRITLGGENVTRRGYSFVGGVFADSLRPGKDFVFADGDDSDAATAPAPGSRVASFAVTSPLTDAFDATAVFPHTGSLVGALPLPIGESTWALFVGDGTFAGASGFSVPADRSAFAADATGALLTRGSVFSDATGAPLPAAAAVGFDWQQREPFAVRLWLPQRLAAFAERLRGLLDRHRAGGVHVYVEPADDRWTLGSGVLRDPGSGEPVGGLVLGTRLWDAEPPPT